MLVNKRFEAAILLAALLSCFIVLVVAAKCQELPDAPSAQARRTSTWKPWQYPSAPTGEVLRSKAFLLTFLGDLAITSSDVEITHAGIAHHRCVEVNSELPTRPSRKQLYVYNVPENAVVGIVSFIWLKVKGPKAVLPAFLAYPAISHGNADYAWVENCW